MALIYNLYTSLIWLDLSCFAYIKGLGGVGGWNADGSSPGRECPFLVLLYQGIGGFCCSGLGCTRLGRKINVAWVIKKGLRCHYMEIIMSLHREIVMDYIRQHRITSYQNGGLFMVTLFGYDTTDKAVDAFIRSKEYVKGSLVRVEDLSVQSKLI